MTKNKNSSLSTGVAAKEFNRRTLIKRGAALAAFAPVAPMFVKNAFAATSGQQSKGITSCDDGVDNFFLERLKIFKAEDII